jgi:hypothetical protein
MIEIPIGKAIIVVEKPVGSCKGCYFFNDYEECRGYPYCLSGMRKDGKNIIFKLINYKEGRD